MNNKIMNIKDSVTAYDIQGEEMVEIDTDGYGKVYIPNDEVLIWDREHLIDEWDIENFPNTYIVHGHTPIKDRWLTDDGIYRYAKGHKIDIDRQTYNREDCVLLDLDNLEAAPIKFKVKKREDEERKNG